MKKNKFFKKAISIFLAAIMVSSIGIGFSAPAFSAPVNITPPIYRDTSYSFEERAADMVARMSLAQRTSQMVSSMAAAIPAGDDAAGTIGTGIRQYGWWNEALHGYSSNTMTDNANAGGVSNATSYPIEFSLGQSWDPELVYRISTQISDEIRELCPGMNSNLNFYSPTVNLSRDPRWGRNSESWGEDPLLSGKLASQFINGFEGLRMDGKTTIDPNGYYKAHATLKHYLANNSENNRLEGVAAVTEQENREYYSAVYRNIIKWSSPASVMSSYNRYQISDVAYSPFKEMPNGINFYTLDTLLRQTFGFQGYVTGDCNSTNDAGGSGGGEGARLTSETQGSAAASYTNAGHSWRAPAFRWYGAANPVGAMTETITNAQIAAWAVMGGANLECNNGATGSSDRGKAYQKFNPDNANPIVTPLGNYTEQAVDVALLKLMAARLRNGEWDDRVNYTDAPSGESTGRVTWFEQAKERLISYGLAIPTTQNGMAVRTNARTMTDARMALVGEAAAKSIVLLKNDAVPEVNGGQPILPINVPATGSFSVGVYGSMAARVTLGLYASSRSGTDATSKQVNPFNGLSAAIKEINPNATVVNETSVGASAANYDYVIAVVGDSTGTAYSSEQRDRPDFALSANNTDIALINNLAAANKKLIVVMITSCPIGVAAGSEDYFENIPSLLASNFLGDRPGTGIADVVLGKLNPSARTNDTWYPISTPYGAAGNTTDNRLTTGSLNQIRSYRLSPGIDGPWQSPYPTEANPNNLTDPYTFTGPNLGRTYMYYSGSGDKAIRFPFGYGLSYTTFNYSNMKVYVNGVLQTAGTVNANPNDAIDVSFDVTNTGARAGADIAQFYVKTPADVVASSSTASYGQAYAVKRLKDFKKTKELAPGETQNLTLSVEVPDIAFWSNANKKFELVQAADNYVLQISRSSADSGTYNGQNYGVQLSSDLRINNAGAWNPKVSVLSFKPNTPDDAANDIPQRLIYSVGDTVRPNPTISMANDVLYGYINRIYSSSTAQQYPIPSNITVTYRTNRPGVVSTAGGTISAIGGGVATITGTAFDSITGSSASAEFVVYVQGESLPYNVSLASVKADGLDAGISPDGSGYDVYIPVGSAAIPAIVATPAYPDDVDFVYTPPTAVPGVGKITVTSKTIPSFTQDYAVNFGHMAIGELHSINYMGFNSDANVRFSDGLTKYTLIQALYNPEGRLVKINATDIAPIPKNGAGIVHAETDDFIIAAGFTIKVFLWDQNFTPLIPASSEWTEFD